MRLSGRAVVASLLLCLFASRRALADEDPVVGLKGFKCHVVRAHETPIDPDPPVLILCLTEEDPDPYAMRPAARTSQRSVESYLSSRPQLLTAPSNTLQLAQSPQHGPLDTPTPTP